MLCTRKESRAAFTRHWEAHREQITEAERHISLSDEEKSLIIFLLKARLGKLTTCLKYFSLFLWILVFLIINVSFLF